MGFGSVVQTYFASLGFLFGRIKEWLTPRFRYGSGDVRVERLELARSVGGIVVTLAVWVAYEQVGYDSVMGSLSTVMINAAVALPAVVVGIAILFGTIAPADRSRLLRAVRRPAVTVLACLAVGLAFDFVLGSYKSVRLPGLATILAVVVILALLLYVMPSILWAAYWGYRYWFNAADGHPLLPALCSIVFSVGILGVNTYQLARGDLSARIPGPLAVLLTFGSPPLVIALALWEIKLAGGQGVTLRALPPERRSAVD
ncbi:hypothetical protein B0I31_10448 [Saccharothrix carnea]|uniref:Uncharacterized protein n=1 Tax=Saccharothrix carnea TaxID=1280637 RepID=A0A2P8IBD7_SACCR|nr:hypothetical protein [Saccharothrix carnea]PSL55757.1 hypothetical protein B0I31_10448 [Saccharothrix carnea]